MERLQHESRLSWLTAPESAYNGGRTYKTGMQNTETSLLTQYYNEIIGNFQREQRRLSTEKYNIQKDLNALKQHA